MRWVAGNVSDEDVLEQVPFGVAMTEEVGCLAGALR
jgi:hypothetical protein